MTTVVLDNEAVQALLDPSHPKHRRAMAMLDGTSARNRRRKDRGLRLVPTTVRAEAGWDRRQPSSAHINRLRIQDRHLDTALADRSASMVARAHVSAADAHLGAVVERITDGSVVVLTSDPDDVARVCPTRPIRIIRI